jgi:hypothetical protein
MKDYRLGKLLAVMTPERRREDLNEQTRISDNLGRR